MRAWAGRGQADYEPGSKQVGARDRAGYDAVTWLPYLVPSAFAWRGVSTSTA